MSTPNRVGRAGGVRSNLKRKGTHMSTQATAPLTIKVQRSMTRMQDLEDVLLQKSRPFTPVSTAAEALTQLNNNSDAFIRIVNEGLRVELRKQLVEDSSMPWFEVSDDGKVAAEPFTDATVDAAIVSKLIMTFALIRGYNADLSKDQKKTVKAAAREYVKENAAILLKDAVSTSSTEENES